MQDAIFLYGHRKYIGTTPIDGKGFVLPFIFHFGFALHFVVNL